MTDTLQSGPRYWTRPRLFALTAVSVVTVLFVGANAHLIAVAFLSRPDCVLQTLTEGSTTFRAATPSC